MGRRLIHDRSGASAVEFAIVILPLLAFIFLIFQVAIYHFALQSLDHATRLAARGVMVGSLQSTTASANAMRDSVLCPKIILPFNCDNISVNAYKVESSSDEASGTGIYRFIDAATKTLRDAPDGSSFCLGGPGDYIYLDVGYALPSFMGSLLSIGDEGGPATFMLRSRTFFRNEPFAAKGATC